MFAGEAALAGWLKAINLPQHSAIPATFVFQLPQQFAPANIRNGTGSAMVLQHVLDG
jgi:hypothetical protein